MTRHINTMRQKETESARDYGVHPACTGLVCDWCGESISSIAEALPAYAAGEFQVACKIACANFLEDCKEKPDNV